MTRRSRLILVVAGIVAIAAAVLWTRPGTIDQHADVEVPDLTSEAAAGQALFTENCAACHGENGAGTANGPPLIHKYYEPNHHADEAFHLAVTRGVRAHHWQFGNMPPVEGLDRDDVVRIVTYVREVQRANGIN